MISTVREAEHFGYEVVNEYENGAMRVWGWYANKRHAQEVAHFINLMGFPNLFSWENLYTRAYLKRYN